MAQHQLSADKALIEKVNQILNKEGLTYTDDVRVKHFLSVLHEEIGIKVLKSHIRTKYKQLNIAASVGCHALRPAKVTQFDSPAVPTMFDDLVKLTGAKAVDWSKKSECCGAPLLGINDDLSRQIMETKLANALENSAHFIAVACPYSFLQFDRFQTRIARQNNHGQILAPVLYPQLLGLAKGIDPQRLGFSNHMADIDLLTSYLAPIEGKTQEISHD
ncbi:MAG: disulfide reductase [Hyphomicrobiales bacterium]|nr:disulfide reductase [Hyphomicrobiales bacterium]